MKIHLQVHKLLINQSGYCREFHSEKLGWENLVLHTTVLVLLQQLQFKMPVTVIKHHIWLLKVMFSHRKMPEASDFDENQTSIFLTCRSKIIFLCIATEYQCNWFWAGGSHMLTIVTWLNASSTTFTTTVVSGHLQKKQPPRISNKTTLISVKLISSPVEGI